MDEEEPGVFIPARNGKSRFHIWKYMEFEGAVAHNRIIYFPQFSEGKSTIGCLTRIGIPTSGAF
jgi:hypothetical protein